MNTNMNYIRKPGTEYNNNKYNNKYNSYKKKNYWNEQEDKNKKEEDIILKKQIFTNSKLENNGNPEGNYIKIEIGDEEKKKNFNLINIGEVHINDKANNFLLNMNTNKKEIEQKIEDSNNNKNEKESNSGNLPWRIGGIKKKEYYNQKKDNSNYYYNSNKNYNNYYNYNNRNKYPLNQKKKKKGNKFD